MVQENGASSRPNNMSSSPLIRAYPALLKVAKQEGMAGLYKGFAPKVLRLAPGGGVLLLGE